MASQATRGWRALRWASLAVGLVALTAWADADPETVCSHEKDRCADDCSITFGSSYEQRQQFHVCTDHCDERHDLCLLKFVAKREISQPAHPPQQVVAPKPDADKTKPTEAAPYLMPRSRYADPDPTPAAPPSEPSATDNPDNAEAETPPPEPKKPAPRKHKKKLNKETIAPSDG